MFAVAFLAVFGVVAFEVAEAAVAVVAVGSVKGWSGALAAAAAAVLVAVVGAFLWQRFALGHVPERPLKAGVAVLLIGAGVWWLIGALR